MKPARKSLVDDTALAGLDAGTKIRSAPGGSIGSPSGNDETPTRRRPGPKRKDGEKKMPRCFYVSETDYDLLRRVAFTRAWRSGGATRYNVSNLLAEMIEANRHALEQEARELPDSDGT